MILSTIFTAPNINPSTSSHVLLQHQQTTKFFRQNTSCIRKPQVISGGGGVHPSHPPPRSTPVLSHFILLIQTNLAVLSNCSSTAFLPLLLFGFSCMAEPDWTLLTIPAVLGCLSSVWTWTLWKENVRICAENLRQFYQNNSLTPPMYTKNNVIKSILQIRRNGLHRSYNDYWYL